MRVTDIYLSGYGPFTAPEPLHLHTDDERVLFLGVSGSGKSTLFRGTALLRRQLDLYLAQEAPLPMGKGNLALVLKELPFGDGLVLWGGEAFARQIRQAHPGARWLWARDSGFEGDWPLNDAEYPNLICQDDPADWLTLLPDCPEGVEAVNMLLVGKQLEVVDGALQVRLSNGVYHEPELLSMGEKRICLLCAQAGALLQPGGLLLMDEPDMHLHPSQSLGLMTTLENLVLDKAGQMWVISHKESLWQRYEDVGLVISLTREVPHA